MGQKKHRFIIAITLSDFFLLKVVICMYVSEIETKLHQNHQLHCKHMMWLMLDGRSVGVASTGARSAGAPSGRWEKIF